LIFLTFPLIVNRRMEVAKILEPWSKSPSLVLVPGWAVLSVHQASAKLNIAMKRATHLSIRGPAL
jgi:hypothetical protein